VPRKTLDDRIKGRVQHGTAPGPSTVLTAEEEDALQSYLIYMAQHGFPPTRTMTKAFAWTITIREGCDLEKKRSSMRRPKEQLITLQSFVLHLLQVFHSPNSSSTPSLSQVVHMYKVGGPDDAFYRKSQSGWIHSWPG